MKHRAKMSLMVILLKSWANNNDRNLTVEQAKPASVKKHLTCQIITSFKHEQNNGTKYITLNIIWIQEKKFEEHIVTLFIPVISHYLK